MESGYNCDEVESNDSRGHERKNEHEGVDGEETFGCIDGDGSHLMGRRKEKMHIFCPPLMKKMEALMWKDTTQCLNIK